MSVGSFGRIAAARYTSIKIKSKSTIQEKGRETFAPRLFAGVRVGVKRGGAALECPVIAEEVGAVGDFSRGDTDGWSDALLALGRGSLGVAS